MQTAANAEAVALRSGGSRLWRVTGGLIGSGSSKRQGAAPSCPCRFAQARPSSLIGARILPFWVASAPRFKSPTSSCRTAKIFWSGPICRKRMRCCLMPTAVDRVARGKELQVNMRFRAMANHYVFEPAFCNPAAGWDKGQIEKNVQDSRHRLWRGGCANLNSWDKWICRAKAA